MTFLPIVARELRVLSRRRSTYWVRTGAALAVIVIGTWFFLMMQREAPQTVAQVLFGILTGSAILYCLFSGVRSTSDSLSQEKREGTLGLLFLTDLKGYDVVFGKLVATSVNGLYGVLAVVPMLAVPLLMGGITLPEFGRMALVAINTLFLSLTFGMCVSAMSHSAQKAALTTMLLVLFIAAVFPALGAWVAYLSQPRRFDARLFLPSPGYAYFLAWDTNYKTGFKLFWWSLGVVHALGWVALALASIIAPRSWKDKPAGVQKLRWRERMKVWSYGNLVERKAFRTRLLNINAFFWLAGRARLKPALVWAVLGLIGCAWAWGFARFRREWLNEGTYILTGIILTLLLKGWFASEAGRQLAEDRKSGALELLLSTPLTVRDILSGQLLSLMRQFFAPIILILLVELLFLVAGFRNVEWENDRALWTAFWAMSMILLVADLAALYWLGMWHGITAKNPNQAASASLVRIMVLPPIIFGLVWLATTLSAMRGQSDPGWKFFLGIWFGLSLAADLFFGLRARLRLLSEFRLAAAQRYASRPGFWKRIFASDQPGPTVAPPIIAVTE